MVFYLRLATFLMLSIWGAFLSEPVMAGLYPPLRTNFAPHDLSLLSDSGDRLSFKALRSETNNHPLIVLPAFANCNSACPAMANRLRHAVEKSKHKEDVSVLMLSFDPDESQERLATFRTHHNLPKNWRLVKAEDPAQIRDWLNQLGFSYVQNETGQFDHPQAAYIFSADLYWVGSLYGSAIRVEDLEAALSVARGYRSQSPWLRWLLQPEMLAIIGFFGLIASLSALLLRKRIVSAVS